MKPVKFKSLVVLVLFVIVVLGLSGCFIPTTTPTITIEPTITETATDTAIPLETSTATATATSTPVTSAPYDPLAVPIACNRFLSEIQSKISPNIDEAYGYFRDQVIITGVVNEDTGQDHIEEAVTVFNTVNIINAVLVFTGTHPTTELPLSFPAGTNTHENFEETTGSFEGDLVIRLYEIQPADSNFPAPDSLLVASDLNKIDELYPDEASNLSLLFIAEPNYVLRNPDGHANDSGLETIKANVHNGSTGVEGGGGDGLLESSSSAEIWSQDAFAFTGAGQNLINDLTSENPNYAGLGVRVAVLDTSPIKEVGEYSFGYSLYADYPFELCVSNPLDYAANLLSLPSFTSLPGPSAVYTETHFMNEHGLFVASLVHATAPLSEIHLVQVMENHGRGDLFSMLGTMLYYTDVANEGTYRTIINLSLGLEVNIMEDFLLYSGDDNDYKVLVGSYIRSVIARQSFLSREGIWLRPTTINPDEPLVPIFALEASLESTNQQGVLVIAASGNAGEDYPYYPSAYPTVLGVGSYALDGTKSCYSNGADVYAPGGGMTDEKECQREKPCEGYECGVLGMVSTDVFMTGMGNWSGTSFAAPQVSGLAALLWSLHPELPPEDIVEMIRLTASIGAFEDEDGNPVDMLLVNFTDALTP